MKIKSLHIKNFKSIVDLTINEPNPFTVFVGPNGSGKSNIFEALEFFNMAAWIPNDLLNIFDRTQIVSKKGIDNIVTIEMEHDYLHPVKLEIEFHKHDNLFTFNNVNLNEFSTIFGLSSEIRRGIIKERMYFYHNFSRLFIDNNKIEKIAITSAERLSLSCSNLEKVLKRILEDTSKREEISEWLDLFLPEFDRIEVQKSEFSSNENLLIYQKYYKEPFNKELISDGTYNIIALLTAVYQSDEPQFLCIEEPENGLNPKVVKELVNFFRDACEEKGHYIWLNTHSQTLVSQLKEEEMIVVDKVNGETQIKQFKKGDFFGMPADEALLTNALGGGLPW